jgi:hypothetical protein
MGGRGAEVGEVRPQGVGVMGPQGLAADEAYVETFCHRQAASTELWKSVGCWRTTLNPRRR